jgi:hypothetical protein
MQQVRLHHQSQLADIFEEKNSFMAEFQRSMPHSQRVAENERSVNPKSSPSTSRGAVTYNLRCGNDSLGVASIGAANVLWFLPVPASSMISTGTFTFAI